METFGAWLWLSRVLCLAIVVLGATATTLAEQLTEVLHINVAEPTKLSDRIYQNTATLMRSRTGVVAAFYPKPRTGPSFYRLSTDRGHTWGPEHDGPPELGGGAESGTLRDGGVIMPTSDMRHAADGVVGWFEMEFLRFADDFLSWELETVRLYIPRAGVPSVDGVLPGMAKGKIVQLPSGDILASMYGGFKGDSVKLHRSFLVRSTDQGRTWSYHGSIAYEPNDPTPELPGMYLSACEPSVTLLPSGQMVAMVRTQYSHYPGEYKPLAVSWSDDLGKTWTRFVPTRPHLMNISPTLAALDNGVLVCQYGRPGFHVAFSLDDGHTWQDRISFSDLPEPIITGQFDLIKVGPNELVAIGSDHEGVKVWPLSVERRTVSPSHVTFTGRVVDEGGKPIAAARVELGANRYVADDWLEDKETELDVWKAAPKLVGSPRLAYRSIGSLGERPTVTTNVDGEYRFENVALGEHVLTVEAVGYAPRHRHVKMTPRHRTHDFRLESGTRVRGRVVDASGVPIPGVCVVLNRWHCHTDPHGYYHWAVTGPTPREVDLRVYKRYSRVFEILKKTLSFSQLQERPLTLKSARTDR